MQHPVLAAFSAWGGMCVVAIILLVLFGDHGLLGVLWVVVVVSALQLVIRVRQARQYGQTDDSATFSALYDGRFTR